MVLWEAESWSAKCGGVFLRLWVRKFDPWHDTPFPMLSEGFCLLLVSQSAQVLLALYRLFTGT